MLSQTQMLDITCDDATTLQKHLNALYAYEKDISTKVYHRSRIALFQILLSKLIADGAVKNFRTAMDIGCNAGFYSNVISDFGFRDVLGIDLNESYVAKANHSFRSDAPGKRVAFETMDATAIPTDKLYDFVLCTEVIEHTEKPDAVIKSILKLLAPGGIAVISLPNCLSLGYSASCLAALLKGRGISPELRDHMSYPFYKGPRLFRQNGARILASAGVNCMFSDHLLLLLHRAPFFAMLNRFNFWLSRRWPLKCFAQFYFFVVGKDDQVGAHA
jgi:2-polyprenyl-3-methyl-5-hydroxy-6-metoxy-1,4-benzoquinol methylase